MRADTGPDAQRFQNARRLPHIERGARATESRSKSSPPVCVRNLRTVLERIQRSRISSRSVSPDAPRHAPARPQPRREQEKRTRPLRPTRSGSRRNRTSDADQLVGRRDYLLADPGMLRTKNSANGPASTSERLGVRLFGMRRGGYDGGSPVPAGCHAAKAHRTLAYIDPLVGPAHEFALVLSGKPSLNAQNEQPPVCLNASQRISARWRSADGRYRDRSSCSVCG